ncbi:hypothetical protein RI367_004110 [Sorochytrium milnesiophthora]
MSSLYLGTPELVSRTVDAIFSVGLVVIETLNIGCARQFLSEKSLGVWLAGSHVVSFACGGLGGLVSISHCVLTLTRSRPASLLNDIHMTALVLLVVQSYVQSIVILQRLRFVNMDSEDWDSTRSRDKTIWRLVRRKWPEVLFTAGFIATFRIIVGRPSPLVEVATASTWFSSVVFLDIAISLVTLRRLHPLLDNTQPLWTWCRATLRSPQPAPQSGHSRADYDCKLNGWRAVRAWTALMVAVASSCLIYVIGFYIFDTTPPWFVFFRLSWILSAAWQRASLEYIDAIKQIVMLKMQKQQRAASLAKASEVSYSVAEAHESNFVYNPY